MGIIFIIISLVAGYFVYNQISESAKERHKEAACTFYVDQIKAGAVTESTIERLDVHPSVLEYAQKYIPLLYPKWEQIRLDYATIQQNIAMMESRYNKLVAINELNKNKVKTERPKSYQSWLDKQRKELKNLKRSHEDIKQAIEKYYADAEIRGVDSDEEMQTIVKGLVASADSVLGEHGFAGSLVTEKEEPRQAEEPAPKTKEAPHQAEKEDEAPKKEHQADNKARETDSTSEQKKRKDRDEKSDSPRKKNSKDTGKPAASRKDEINKFLALIRRYSILNNTMAATLESITDASSAQKASGKVASTLREMKSIKQQCVNFHFSHVKNVRAEIVTPHGVLFSQINMGSSRIRNRLQLLRSTRWLSQETIRDLTALTKK